MEVAKGVHHFDSGPFNWYLIEENGRFTLVDAGFPGHHKIYRKALQLLGKTSRDIEAVVLTHSHADHIGFAEKVRKETNVPVFCTQKRRKDGLQAITTSLVWFIVECLAAIYSKNAGCCNSEWCFYFAIPDKSTDCRRWANPRYSGKTSDFTPPPCIQIPCLLFARC